MSEEEKYLDAVFEKMKRDPEYEHVMKETTSDLLTYGFVTPETMMLMTEFQSKYIR